MNISNVRLLNIIYRRINEKNIVINDSNIVDVSYIRTLLNYHLFAFPGLGFRILFRYGTIEKYNFVSNCNTIAKCCYPNVQNL